MDIHFILHNIVFEWDSQKAAANFRKHGVTFELTCEAFFDPFVYYRDDEMIEDELRESIIGMSTNWRRLYVVYVMRSDIIRIISARLATMAERDAYENQ
jgi:hypothetical protein